MADMASFDEQMPCIGIFWYDPQEHNFFGVHKKEITPRMVEEAAQMGAEAIVGVRYASSSVMQSAAEVMAYGTAVRFR